MTVTKAELKQTPPNEKHSCASLVKEGMKLLKRRRGMGHREVNGGTNIS